MPVHQGFWKHGQLFGQVFAGEDRPSGCISVHLSRWDSAPLRLSCDFVNSVSFSGNQNCTKKGGGSGSNVISVTCVKPRRWAVLLRYENLRNQAKGQTPPQLGPSKLHRSQNDKRCKNGAETVQFSECRRICFRDSVRYWWRQASRRW